MDDLSWTTLGLLACVAVCTICALFTVGSWRRASRADDLAIALERRTTLGEVLRSEENMARRFIVGGYRSDLGEKPRASVQMAVSGQELDRMGQSAKRELLDVQFRIWIRSLQVPYGRCPKHHELQVWVSSSLGNQGARHLGTFVDETWNEK
jgi:hypothetical protein